MYLIRSIGDREIIEKWITRFDADRSEDNHIIMACYKPVTHVIFDLDGTILDTDEVLINLIQSVISKYGKHLTCSQRAQCMLLQSREMLSLIVKEHNLPMSVKELYHFVVKEFRELPDDSYKLKPGVESLVKHLYDNNVPLAIATNAPKALYDITTKNHQELMNYFHHLMSAVNEPEVERDKPAPDVFLVCASRFDDKPAPEKVLVIEDSSTGVQAAVAAGMQVVAVPNPLVDAKYFENATLVLKTLESFQPELFGLPPFSNKR